MSLPQMGRGLPSGGVTTSTRNAILVVIDAVATNQTAGLTLQNSTAAAAGAQQYSPMVILEGRGWKTDAAAASQKVEWALQNRPVQGAANPTSVLDVMSQINSGGWTKPMTITSAGLLTILGNFTLNSVVLTDNSSFLSNTSAGFLAIAASGYRLAGSLGQFTAASGVTQITSQANIGALKTEQANGATTDRWRVWHDGGTMTAGNLLSWGDGAVYTEKGKIDSAGDVFVNSKLDKLATGTLTLGGTTATAVQVGRSGQSVGFFGVAPAVAQLSLALTNNVTAGGVNDTIANYTDLTTYATDAAAIRNNIYQLARTLARLNAAIRLFGLVSD